MPSTPLIAGAVLQVVGFGLSFANVRYLAKRELPGGLRELLPPLPHKPQTLAATGQMAVQLRGSAAATSSMTATVTTPQPLDQRVAVLEQQLAAIDQRERGHATELEDRVRSLGESVRYLGERIPAAIEAVERGRRSVLRRSLQFQIPAAVLFAVGTLLEVFGS